MTKSQTLQNVTNEYLNSLVIASIDDIDKIEEELLSKVHEAFDEHNIICDKDKKWKIPDGLVLGQVADVLNKVFTIRKIRCSGEVNNESYDLLGIYVNELLVNYLGDYHNKLGIYVTDETIFMSLINKFTYNLTPKQIDEIKEKLRIIATRDFRCDDPDLIAVANGIFNYKTKELYDFSSERIFLTKSQVAYNHAAQNVYITMPDGEVWDVESWMESLAPNEPELANLLWQIIGAIIRPNVRWNKAAFLVSEIGCNGKGTLCELMRAVCGEGSYTSIPLSAFGENFMLEPLLSASAIIVDENDVGGGFLSKAANLKAVITNDVIQINRKGKIPVTYQFRGFMVQCLNEVVRVKDKSDSYLRRQIYIPMRANFAGNEERTYIKDVYIHRQDVLEYVLKKVLEMDYYSFDIPECCKDALEDFKQMNNPVYDFWTTFKDEFAWNLLPFSFLHELYCSWFKRTKPSGTPQSDKTFINDLLLVVNNDSDWCCENKSKQYYTKTKESKKYGLDKTEFLIAEYDLDNWKNKSKKKSQNLSELCKPFFGERYRGLVRKSILDGADTCNVIIKDDSCAGKPTQEHYEQYYNEYNAWLEDWYKDYEYLRGTGKQPSFATYLKSERHLSLV